MNDPNQPVELPPNDVLRQMFAEQRAADSSGRMIPTGSGIAPVHAAALYRMTLAEKPSVVIEIGMAFGFSSLSILAALDRLGRQGRLISIDPHQKTDWHGAGVEAVRRAGFESMHELIDKPSYLALPELLGRKTVVDLAYVDGWHTFDYVLLDFFYLDKLLRQGGVCGFNDCGLAAVHRVLSFMRTHRKYEELDAGLKRDYTGRNFAVTCLRRILRWPRSDRYFRKTEAWEPGWNFYARF